MPIGLESPAIARTFDAIAGGRFGAFVLAKNVRSPRSKSATSTASALFAALRVPEIVIVSRFGDSSAIAKPAPLKYCFTSA